MSKLLRYTLVGEGFAEYQFIPAYMVWAVRQVGDLQVARTNVQIAITKNPSVSKVLQEAAELCNQSFADTRNPGDLFLAGIDLDKSDFTDDLAYHTERIQELKGRMGKVYKQYEDRTILYVPVQAIDCWVWYVQQNATANSLESTGKSDTKKAVYGSSNPDRQRIEKVVREAAARADFDELAKQSRSFNHFHRQVTDFLDNYSKNSIDMNYYNSIIETIGNTPLVRLNRVTKGIRGTVLAKVEYFNPGNSVKDRIAVRMIEDAEKQGTLKPGGTIIEGTSGNTGFGLALTAIAKGYKCIFVITDKQSPEKVDILRAVGAEVIVCPTNVAPDDPRSYYSTARRLNQETPNSIYPNQYDNPSNALAHYETTGPEIWRDTDGKITHFAASVGTGGTISGTSKFLKEQNPDVFTLGLDTYGSIYKKYKETGIFDTGEVYPYLTEGIGEDILPKNAHFEVIDQFEKVTDKDGAIMARRLAREEGLFIGWSCGTAVHGALEWAKGRLTETDVMVIVLPDHGTRYLGKIYNDTWMKDHGFLEDRAFKTARDIVHSKNGSSQLTTIGSGVSVSQAIQVLNRNGISQIPVTGEDGHIVGSLTDSTILNRLINDPSVKDLTVSEVMDKPFKFVGLDNTVDALSSLIDRDNKALLVRDDHEQVHIITQADLLAAMTN